MDREPSSSGRASAGVEPGALLAFAGALAQASSQEELERAFALGFGPMLDVRMCGFYALDAEGGGIAHNVAVNVSDLFVARYERAMERDPLLVEARSTGRPVYNLALMSAREWEESEAYRLAYATHRMRHVAELPVASGGRLVGALHFASSDPARSFEASDFALADAIGGVLGAAIDRIGRQQRTALELDRARAALELAGVAVVVADPAALDLERNAAARRLLSEIVDGEGRLLELLARPAGPERHVRRLAVELVGGGTGELYGRLQRVGGPEAGLVAVLELRGDHERIAPQRLAGLTPRERDVATLVVEGLTDREIAARLALSRHTVGQHTGQIYRKLGVRSRAQLIAFLLRGGRGRA
jgi:DNA-binding CsgD family transcriptional regulator/GAF domain-containing protein